MPDDHENTFMILAQNKILPMELAVKIAKSVGLRKIIVHKYGKVDLKKMVDDIRENISQYLEYLKLINQHYSQQKNSYCILKTDSDLRLTFRRCFYKLLLHHGIAN